MTKPTISIQALEGKWYDSKLESKDIEKKLSVFGHRYMYLLNGCDHIGMTYNGRYVQIRMTGKVDGRFEFAPPENAKTVAVNLAYGKFDVTIRMTIHNLVIYGIGDPIDDKL